MSLNKNKPIYICGPMSWKPQFNVPAFLHARDELWNQGYQVQLPADLDDPEVVEALLASPDGDPTAGTTDLTWGDCLAMDVKLIADVCGGVAVLPGWKHSKGARLETFVNFLVGGTTVYYTSMKTVPQAELFKAWHGEVDR